MVFNCRNEQRWPSRLARALVLVAVICTPGCLDWAALQDGRCGDGFVGREEACDDGNRAPGDGCDQRCRLETAECGDGRIDVDVDVDDDEACDDGGRVNGDGCDERCQLEPIAALCGNAEPDPGEACDDGNTSNEDACLNGCSRATCGDGQLRRGIEECDPGSVDNGSECTPACLLCGADPLSHFRAGNAHCFSLHPEPATEVDARAACQAEGGDLWTITSQAEGSDVAAQLALSGPYWLGLSTSATGRTWVSGEGFKYQSFAPNEPSAPAARCVSLVAAAGEGAGLWQSSPCDTLLSFVCERAGAFVSVTTNHAYKLRTATVSFEEARALCRAALCIGDRRDVQGVRPHRSALARRDQTNGLSAHPRGTQRASRPQPVGAR